MTIANEYETKQIKMLTAMLSRDVVTNCTKATARRIASNFITANQQRRNVRIKLVNNLPGWAEIKAQFGA